MKPLKIKNTDMSTLNITLFISKIKQGLDIKKYRIKKDR